MLERITNIAEQAAMQVSRRQFVGRFGRGAAAAAAALGGLMALPTVARCGRKARRRCNADSDPSCINATEGSNCGSSGVCKADPKDKSIEPVCHCVKKNGGGGGRGGGPRRRV